MVNPTDEMQTYYTYLLELEEIIFQQLVPGSWTDMMIRLLNDDDF